MRVLGHNEEVKRCKASNDLAQVLISLGDLGLPGHLDAGCLVAPEELVLRLQVLWVAHVLLSEEKVFSLGILRPEIEGVRRCLDVRVVDHPIANKNQYI